MNYKLNIFIYFKILKKLIVDKHSSHNLLAQISNLPGGNGVYGGGFSYSVVFSVSMLLIDITKSYLQI